MWDPALPSPPAKVCASTVAKRSWPWTAGKAPQASDLPGDLAGPLQHRLVVEHLSGFLDQTPLLLSWPSAGIRDSQGISDDSPESPGQRQECRVQAGWGQCAGDVCRTTTRAPLLAPRPSSRNQETSRPCPRLPGPPSQGAEAMWNPASSSWGPSSPLQLQTRASFCCQPCSASHCLESAKLFLICHQTRSW